MKLTCSEHCSKLGFVFVDISCRIGNWRTRSFSSVMIPTKAIPMSEGIWLCNGPMSFEQQLICFSCFFGIHHYPDVSFSQRQLTYRMVENVLKGLWDFVYRREKFVSAHILVTDDVFGVVGAALLKEGRPEKGAAYDADS